jgi:thiol-disulfide isomerase/thioredoxin
MSSALPTRHRVHAIQRLAGLLLAGALLLAAGPAALAGNPGNLQHAGAAARAQGGAVLLVFRADYCGYCERLENEILQPWQRSASFDRRLQVQHVDLAPTLVTDFDGQLRSGHEVATRYRVQVTPTVLVVDGDGQPLEEALVGLNSVDFYPAYLEATVARALARVAR